MKAQIIILVIALLILGASARWYLGRQPVPTDGFDVGESAIISEGGEAGVLGDDIISQSDDDALLAELEAIINDLNSDEVITTADALNTADLAAEEEALTSLGNNITTQISDESNVGQAGSNLNEVTY